MQDENDWNALCELIRSGSDRRFVLLSHGVPPGCLIAFRYTGLMAVLGVDDLLFDREDARRLLHSYGVEATEGELTAILRESAGSPLDIAVTARGMSGGNPFSPEVAADSTMSCGRITPTRWTAMPRAATTPRPRSCSSATPSSTPAWAITAKWKNTTVRCPRPRSLPRPR